MYYRNPDYPAHIEDAPDLSLDDRVKLEIENLDDKHLNEEIEHFLNVDVEEGNEPDYYEALDQAHDLALDLNDRKVLTPARKVLISLGVFRHITDDELAGIQTFSSSGSKRAKYDFILNKKKYIFVDHPWNRQGRQS